MNDATKETGTAKSEISISTLEAVRKRGLFFIELLVWGLAISGFLVLFHYMTSALCTLITTAEKARRIIGLSAPTAGPDWFLLGVCGAIFLILLAILTLIGSWYGNIWRKRLSAVWRTTAQWRKFERVLPLDRTATAEGLKHRTDYLRALLASDAWRERWEPIKKQTGLKDKTPATLAEVDYEKITEAVFRDLGTEIRQRAVAIGLAVGLSQSKFADQLLILSASIELQLHVLSRLGKRPNWRVWRGMAKRSLGSLFLNTYLNREDAFALQFIIRQTAMGFAIGADLADEGAQALSEIDFADADGDEFAEELEKSGGALFEGVPFIGGVLATGSKVAIKLATFSLKTGAIGLQQVASLTETYGRDMLQGVLAGAILHAHGTELAADCLAVDSTHRRSEAFKQSFFAIAKGMAADCGTLLANQIRRIRELYRAKRKACFKTLGRRAKSAKTVETTEAPA